MGYRSDGCLIFYTIKPDLFPAVKLWAAENIERVCPDLERTEFITTFFDRQVMGICYKFESWKWYPSYPEVAGVTEARDRFCFAFQDNESDHEEPVSFEWVRLGEESNDIETFASASSHGLLSVSRQIITEW